MFNGKGTCRAAGIRGVGGTVGFASKPGIFGLSLGFLAWVRVAGWQWGVRVSPVPRGCSRGQEKPSPGAGGVWGWITRSLHLSGMGWDRMILPGFGRGVPVPQSP